MPQVRESCCCGIFAFFFQCCFMIETQVLMTVSDFLGFFSRNHFVERGFTFQWEDLFFRRVASFLSVCGRCHMGALVLMGGGGGGKEKNSGGWGHHLLPLWETLQVVSHFSNKCSSTVYNVSIRFGGSFFLK